MADNVPITAGSGTTVATDDVSTVHYQKVKLADGAADSSAMIGGDATNGLDVDVTRVPADPFGANADASAVDGSISAKLRSAATSLEAIDDTVYDDDEARVRTTAIGATFDDVSPTAITENQVGYLRMSSRRALLVEGVASGTAQAVSGSVTVSGTVTASNTAGDIASGTANSGNPVQMGVEAIAHGSNPSAVAAGSRTKLYANRAGIPFTIGGHPNVVTLKHTTITTAVTDAAIITVSTGTKIVVTAFTVTLDNASTVFPTFLMGFGTANTPTTTGVLGAHGGIPAGGGFSRGDGSGILGIGADNEDLRVTTTGNATGNGLQIVVTYYLIES